MRYVKYIGEDETFNQEQIYPVIMGDVATGGWFIEHLNEIWFLRKHEAVEVTGFMRVAPVTLMIDTSIIKAYKQKALKLHEEGEIVSWEYLMVEAIKEGLK